jgi:hypothetical protein
MANGRIKELAIQRLEDLSCIDPAHSHLIADQILLETLRLEGLGDVADAYERAEERVGFWYS